MYNINHGFKFFTSMMAYADSPVHKAISLENLSGIDKGIITVGNDGGISVWQWKKPHKAGGFNKGGFSRGGGSRGGYRGGRGGGRGFGRGSGGQGAQGRGF